MPSLGLQLGPSPAWSPFWLHSSCPGDGSGGMTLNRSRLTGLTRCLLTHRNLELSGHQESEFCYWQQFIRAGNADAYVPLTIQPHANLL